jgi:hypothetical protein
MVLRLQVLLAHERHVDVVGEPLVELLLCHEIRYSTHYSLVHLPLVKLYFGILVAIFRILHALALAILVRRVR